MTDPAQPDGDDLDLDLDLQLDLEPLAEAPAASAAPPTMPAISPVPGGEASLTETAPPAGAGVVAEPPASRAVASSAAEDESLVGGQWVWQYGAPPPPPPFSAAFFSGQALSELYRFFACGLLVFIGCLLPWGKSVSWAVQHGESTLAYSAPPAGYELPVGALCLAIAVWLMFVACYGIYTGRQKVLPVFLMLVPAGASWSRTLDAWKEIGALPQKLETRDALAHLFDVAGPGVLLTLIGSTIIVLSLLIVIVKVFRKQPGESGAKASRAARKTREAPKEPVPAADAPGADPAAGSASAPAVVGESGETAASEARAERKDRKERKGDAEGKGKGRRR